jgi:outer membrane lipoprotein-sorting protein
MNEPDRNSPDDLLEQAISALRNQPVPPGPSPLSAAATLSALRKAERPQNSIWRRITTMTFTQKIAAAFAMTLGGLTIYFMLSLFGGFSSISYADVAKQIEAARSMTCRITTDVKTPGAQGPVTVRMMFMDPNKMRVEISGITTITDMTAHRVLTLDAVNKTATIMDLSFTGGDGAPHGNSDFIRDFKSLATLPGEAAGEMQIGSVKAKGFRVQKDGMATMVYADPKTGSPLRIEYTFPSEIGTVVMSDFDFDANLDPSLFSLAVPAGYTTQKYSMQFNMDLLENLIPVLRAYAQHKDGKFPTRLNDWGDVIKTLMPDTKPGDMDSMKSEMMALGGKIGAISGTLFSLEKGKQWDYYPNGIKLGDADKILFWHQPKNSKTYKAIYGDLHTADLTAEQLPQPPAGK